MSNNGETASMAIDRMISMTVCDDGDRTNTRESFHRHRLAIRNHLSKIDSLRRLAWNLTGPKQLARAEMKILERLKSPFEGRFVSILNGTVKIWTIGLNLSSTNIPLVLLHGFGGGVALWSLNLDQLSTDRPVYAIDLPGFARSSRPLFRLRAREVEEQYVQMFEEWRQTIGLTQPFLLLGHSFGGYLSAAYSLRYSENVRQLILIDPWGFAPRPKNIWQTGRLQKIPTCLRSLSPVFLKVSPLTALRAAGPLGVPAIKYFRADLRTKFEKFFDDDRILIYLYHCNAQSPTGEQAFRTMSDCFAWAKEPMAERIYLLDERIPIYFLHGGESWISDEGSRLIAEKRKNVFIETIEHAGHHIYVDVPDELWNYLTNILSNNDEAVVT